MAMIAHWFTHTLISTLETSLLVGLVMLSIALFGSHLAPVWRYALWLLVVVKLLLPLLPGQIETRIRWLKLPGTGSITERAALHHQPAVVERQTDNLLLWLEGQLAEAQSPIVSSDVMRAGDAPIMQIMAVCWLLGVAAVLLHMLIGAVRFHIGLLKEDSIAAPHELREQFEQLRARAGIRRQVELRMTNQVPVPTLYGLLKPVVLIPHRLAERLEKTEWACIFRHEFTHFRRMDIAVNLIFTLLAAVHWFNPVIWYGLHRMRMDQESACDAQTLEAGSLPHCYAACFIKVLESSHDPGKKYTAAGVGLLSNKEQITRRIIMIRDYRPAKRSVAWLGGILLLAIALLALPSVMSKEAAAAGEESSQTMEDGAAVTQENPLGEQTADTILFAAPVAGTVTKGYGERIHPVTAETEMHDGIDIASEAGTEIHAAADGVVLTAAYDPVFGNRIVLDHNEIWQSEYRHLAEFAVQVGDTVRIGDLIGIVGSTGQATGAHLHISILKSGAYVDPAEVLKP